MKSFYFFKIPPEHEYCVELVKWFAEDNPASDEKLETISRETVF